MKSWAELLKHFDDPCNDNERLFNLQYEYLTTGNKKAWHDMYLLFYKVCGNVIKSICREKKIRILEQDDFQEKQSIACEYVMRRFIAKKYKYGYKEAPKYYISTNWIEVGKMAVIHALNYTTKADMYFNDDIDDLM